MRDPDQQDDTYSEEEIVARREAALKRAFASPTSRTRLAK
jgi:hypothetical protein